MFPAPKELKELLVLPISSRKIEENWIEILTGWVYFTLSSLFLKQIIANVTCLWIIFDLSLWKQKHCFHGLYLKKRKGHTNKTDKTGRKLHPGLLKGKCIGAQSCQHDMIIFKGVDICFKTTVLFEFYGNISRNELVHFLQKFFKLL
jgi:hypothetical protein